jgi:hypothetical protein
MPKFLTFIWNKLDGYKMYSGLLITLLAFLADWIPQVMAAAHANPDLIAKVVGGIVAVLGILHRIYKVPA